MAEKKSPSGAADFIAKIVKDPKNPPETLMLTGFIGASSEENHTRLYFDAGLGSYVEIPNDAILHTEPAGDEGLGASYVWIKRDAVLIHGPAGSQRPKGTFLEGAIMQQHLGAAAAGAGAQVAAGGNPRSDFVACQSWICPPTPNCPRSDFVACNSWICPPTPHAHCPPSLPLLCVTVHCTVPPQCPHLSVPPHCPSVAPICPPHTAPPPCPLLSAPPRCPTVPPICPHPSLPPMCHLPTHPPQCPLLSAPPNCPTVGGCQSIACQSAACQPGGGQQAVGLEAAANPVSAVCVTAIACNLTMPQICGIVPPSVAGPCLTQQPHCVTNFIPCPTPQCPTHWHPCPTPQCPTHWHPCPTHQIHCPSVVMICPLTAVCQIQA
jgi:hypothetical protein